MLKRKNDLKIIAEIAQGFEGNFEQSKLLIKAAAKAGADLVKFQLVYADELATVDYQYYTLFKELEMEEAQWKWLKDYASSLGTQLIVDVFGEKSLATAENIGIETVKVHGTDVTNLGLLEAISASSIEKVVLGVGGAHWGEIEQAIKVLKNKHLVLLCGFQGYPTKTEDNHVIRMNFIKQKATAIHPNFQMGFADHPGEESHIQSASHITFQSIDQTDSQKVNTLLSLLLDSHSFSQSLSPHVSQTVSVSFCPEASQSVSWSVSYSVSQSIHKFIDFQISQSIPLSVPTQTISLSDGQSLAKSANQSVSWLMSQLMNP